MMPGYIPWSQVERTLAATRSIWVSTTRPEGRPHAMPVWFIWDDGSIYFITGRASQKAKNLARQPAIVVHTGDGDDVIIVEGVVEIVGEHAERQRFDQVYGDKYVDPYSGAKAGIGEDDNLYRVRTQRVMTWEYGVVSTRTDWVFDGGESSAAASE
jgi:PPOX class probable F420-dependent enzyme